VQFTRPSPTSFCLLTLDSSPAKKPIQLPIQLMPSSSVLILKCPKREVVEQPLVLYINTGINMFILVKSDVLTDINACTITCMDVTLA
jgi:hypothetical protein